MHPDQDNPASAAIPIPRLSDDAVVQIRDFIGHFLSLFEARYGDQIHCHYENRSAHNIVSAESTQRIDDPPF